MSSLFQELQRNKTIKTLASLRITVVCLILLFILTFWGTVAQVENGLYASQERYFSSFYFLAMGFFPFPGAHLVLWVLGINLVCSLFNKKLYSWSQIGIIIIHYGLVLFLVAAFATFHESRETHLTLREGQAANVSEAYSDWEIALLQEEGNTRIVTALDVNQIKEGTQLTFGSTGMSFLVKNFYRNCLAYSASFADVKEKYLNSSGINILQAAPLEKEPEKNVPGLILSTIGMDNNLLILLFGRDSKPVEVTVDKKEFSLILRHQHFPLPVTIRLIDFMMEKHPGTQIARSYKSRVAVEHDGSSREVVISMNEPLRYKQYTFYQSSYQIDEMGNEFSTLAVVKNSAWTLPYWATFVVVFGLALHFLMAAFATMRDVRLKT